MRKTFRYKAKLNRKAEARARQQLHLLCDLYNNCLEHRKTLYRGYGISVSSFEQMKELTEIKRSEGLEVYQEIGSQVLQETVGRVDLAFKHFFRRVKNGETPGYPRFKGKRYYKSLTFKQAGWKFLGQGRIHLQGIGNVKFFESRPIKGEIKTVTLKRDRCGDWFLYFSCDNVEPELLTKTGQEIGLDMGLEKFLTDDKNNQVTNPRFLRKSERNLKLEQRKLAKKGRSGKNREKQRVRVAKLHRKVSRQRTDFHFKTAHYLVKNYDKIVVEDLDIKGMIEKECQKGLNKSIHDVGWASFMQVLLFKAEKAGKEVVMVDPRNTSQLCSNCRSLPKAKKTLRDRTHKCDCGARLDRDHNAARNILARSNKIYEVGKQPLASAEEVNKREDLRIPLLQ